MASYGSFARFKVGIKRFTLIQHRPGRIEFGVRPYFARIVADPRYGATTLDAYDWTGRSGRRHRHEILQFLSVRTFDGKAEACLRAWLINEVLPKAPNVSHLADLIADWRLSNRMAILYSYEVTGPDRRTRKVDRNTPHFFMHSYRLH